MKQPAVRRNVSILREKLSKSIGLPFTDLLPESFLQSVLREEKVRYRKRLFCPIVTLWTWTSQVLDADKSCKNAVSRVVSYLIASGKEAPSTNTSAYCQARARLLESFLLRLLRKTGGQLHSRAEAAWRWCGREVFVVDGSRLTMTDSEANQDQYPQPKSQKKGCGFPAARIVMLFSLFTGAVLDSAISALSIGEINLFRQLYANLQSGSIALGDRLFGSYADIVLLKQRLVDCVFRLSASRKGDFRKGKRISRCDRLLWWDKPKKRPVGLTKAEFDQLPEHLMVREVRFHIALKGFRTELVTLVTTLLDHKTYSVEALAELYGLRWQAEIDIRHLKTTMEMEHLHNKTPEMVRKEFYVHLLAYNLIRQLQSEASKEHGVTPITLSFKATIQHLCNFLMILAFAQSQQRLIFYRQLIALIANEKLPLRPNRVEPRAVKRRPKAYQRLNQPRNQLRRKCINRKIDPKTGRSIPSY